MAGETRNSCLARALARWQHAAGRYWLYVCSAPFVGDRITIDRSGAGRPSRLVVDAVRSIPEEERAAIFVDLPTRLSLPSTPRLNDLGYVVVPVIQRWVTEPALLRSARLVDQLIRYGASVRRPRPDRGVIFILDGERAGPLLAADSPTPKRTFDNRYAYPSCRFPPPALLREDAISRVWWLTPRGIADDLADYAARLEAEGFPPVVIGHARAYR